MGLIRFTFSEAYSPSVMVILKCRRTGQFACRGPSRPREARVGIRRERLLPCSGPARRSAHYFLPNAPARVRDRASTRGPAPASRKQASIFHSTKRCSGAAASRRLSIAVPGRTRSITLALAP